MSLPFVKLERAGGFGAKFDLLNDLYLHRNLLLSILLYLIKVLFGGTVFANLP